MIYAFYFGRTWSGATRDVIGVASSCRNLSFSLSYLYTAKTKDKHDSLSFRIICV
jgi:hypothetical protein